ncbi:hypothetical protein OIU84_024711 [Salix udensis]|uniref:Uncharacterized protein n=1 Tax=Salix udensis TaxID=889485 RepID=A0AAD6KI13_9ROSI|nr:hypothetical protein OIU84_024711 [Salix udensis]
MGDPTHLEKMGRELKCPICLSLLDNAVSLTCNHFFCNSCIVKSMKSGSDCPVCKLPYRRREIRAAPHMDNLVSIYKSMEIASGFNIFVTQNPPPPTKLSDVDCGREDNDRLCRDMSEEQLNITRQKDLRKLDKSHTELSGPITLKPSFPTKKRVQVPQRSLSDTLAQPEKLQTGSREIKKDDFKNDSSVSRENPAVDERGERMLLPFFWLRDEDGEKSSQHSDVDQLLDITPPNVPTFSDFKDSDDETPPESPSKGAVCGSKSNVADFFDSEMFEWTQRACSPEIFPSPAKMQAEKTAEMDGIRERNSETPPLDANTNEERSDESKICIYTIPRMGASEDILANLSSPIVKSASYQIESNTSNKRGRNARDTTLRNCARKNADKDTGATVVATRVSGKTTEKTLANKGCVLISGKIGEWKKDGRLKRENVSSVSVRENSNQGDENTVTDQMPISLDQKQGRSNLKRKKNGKVSREISLRCKERKLDSVEINMIKEVHSTHNQIDKDEHALDYFLPVPVVEDKKISEIKGKTGKQGEEVKSALSSEHNQDLKCKRDMEVSLDGILEDGLVSDHQGGVHNVSAEVAQSTENITGSSAKATESAEKVQTSLNTGILDDLATLRDHCRENGAMLDCKLNHNIRCAFCLSSEDSEASGEMIHFNNGVPVAADYNGGSRVIHSHKNCAEWAPNVYFEDDNAINLEAELARSRRIKCCCCGLKGAALGCYEKSCRKSFHVPCAKLIHQCRWDTENFVILCPLHASCKLPNESKQSQERRKNCISKGQTPRHCNQVTFKHDINMHQSWKSCLTHDKLVLCCSALTVGEKEIVSEFESLSGVTVLKNWDLSVTHVIASTDENGTCRRTLKVLKGILKGTWIVNIEWVKACIKSMKLVEEMRYEITADVHGIRDGPRNGRLRVLNRQPNIFEGLKFYFMGDFIPSYKGYIQDLLVTGGGTILHRKPISGVQGTLLLDSKPPTFIIYSLEVPDKCGPSKKKMIITRRQSAAEALASSTGAKAVSNKWVLNSIAACKLQSLAK